MLASSSTLLSATSSASGAKLTSSVFSPITDLTCAIAAVAVTNTFIVPVAVLTVASIAANPVSVAFISSAIVVFTNALLAAADI